MSSSPSEMELIERVFLRLGAAETDEQLEQVVNKFLIPLIRKISTTNNDTVRDNIIELLGHMNKRLRRRPCIQLPVEALLDQYLDPDANVFFLNFSIVYIKIGYPRLSIDKRVELAPKMLYASGKAPKKNQDSFLYLITTIAGNLTIAHDTMSRRQVFKMDDQPELMKGLSNIMLDFLVAPYGRRSENNNDPYMHYPVIPPPGMSEYGFQRVIGYDPTITASKLENIKRGILNFIGTGILPDEEILCHLIIASTDTRHSVVNEAESLLRKINSREIWRNPTVSSRLFLIYLGTSKLSPLLRNVIPASNKVAPASISLRLKLMPFFCQLEDRAILYPASSHLIFDTLSNSETTTVLKDRVLNFALVVVHWLESEHLNNIASRLYTKLFYIAMNIEEPSTVRASCYAVIARLVKRSPQIITSLRDISLYFENLNSAYDNSTNVRDVLMEMIDGFRLLLRSQRQNQGESNSEGSRDFGAPSKMESDLITFLSPEVESDEDLARNVAVHYVASLFDSGHVESRFLLLLATGDPFSDISKFAKQSLYDEIERRDNGNRFVTLPDFSKMVEYTYENAMERLDSLEKVTYIGSMESPFQNEVFLEILTFLRLCLAQASSVELTNKDLMIHPCEHSPLIRRFIVENHEKKAKIFNMYLELVEMLFLCSPSAITLDCLNEFLGTCPELFAGRFLPKFRNALPLLNNPKADVRDSAAFFLSSLTIFGMNEIKVDETIASFLDKDESIEAQHGSILALGYILGMKKIKLTRLGVQYEPGSWPLHEKIILNLAKCLDSSHEVLLSAACKALSHAVTLSPMPLVNHKGGCSRYTIMKKLLSVVVRDGIPSDLTEKAIEACGKMCPEDDFPFAEEVLKNLVDISKKTDDINIHLAIGESVVLGVEGASSPEKRDKWRILESEYTKPPMTEKNVNLLNSLLDKLISDTSDSNQCSRQSIGVILLYIAKKFYSILSVEDKLFAVQDILMVFLSDDYDLIEDVASKGLALLYENASPEDKDAMLARLINYLLSDETSVEGALDVGQRREGNRRNEIIEDPKQENLLPYKIIANIALELNRPDLIYNLMYLGRQEFVPGSKKGAAFGFGTATYKARQEVAPFLPNIIPRVYRYLFHPFPKVWGQLTNIWNALVDCRHKIVAKYFHELFDDLIINSTSNQWSVREACVLGLADLFAGTVNVMDARVKFEPLWNSLFRLMDDRHEETRLAARKTAVYLANQFLSGCNLDISEEAEKQRLSNALSVFVTGLSHSSNKVKNLCLVTITHLVRKVGPLLKSDVETIITSLFEAANENAPLGSSHLLVRNGDHAYRDNAIDYSLTDVVDYHNISQTISRCVEIMEVETLHALASKVLDIMKGNNLGSKLIASHFMVLISKKFGRSMESYAGKFLITLVRGLRDPNLVARRNFAFTIGHVLQVAKPSSAEKLFKKLSKLYLENEDKSLRRTIGFALQCAISISVDLVKRNSDIVLPLVLFATQEEPNEENQSIVWEDIWDDISPGYEACINRQTNGILDFIEKALSASSWTTKAQAGKCLHIVANNASGIGTRNRKRLIDISLNALKGVTYPGKEYISKGLAKLCMDSASDVKQYPDVCQYIVEALFKECYKRDVFYIRNTVEALGNVLEAFDNIDYFQNVYELIQTIFEKLDGEDLTRDEKYLTMGVMYVFMGKSWPRNKETQIRFESIILNCFYNALIRNPQEVQDYILIALNYFVEKLHYFDPESTSTDEENNLKYIIQRICGILCYSLEIQTTVEVKKKALNIVSVLAPKLISAERNEEMKIVTESLKNKIQQLEESNLPELRTRLTGVKEFFNP